MSPLHLRYISQVHAQLMARVRRAEVLRQKQHRALWEVRLLEWRRLRHEQALTNPNPNPDPNPSPDPDPNPKPYPNPDPNPNPNHEQALTTFKALLHSQEVVQPPQRKTLLKELEELHADFQAQREETAATLGRLAPPQLTEITAGRVRTALEALVEEEAQMDEAVVVKLREAETEMAEHIATLDDRLKRRLIYFAHRTPEEIETQLQKEVHGDPGTHV